MNRQPTELDEPEHSVKRFLLSHHPPRHIHRTIRLRCGNSEYRICARCLGLVSGMIAAGLLSAAGLHFNADGIFGRALLPAMTLPAIVDFASQLTRKRESTNLRRLLTGALFGAALALSIHRVSQGQWADASTIVLLVAAFFVWTVSSRRRLAGMLRHLRLYAEYYERCRADDARRAANRRTIKV
ncbi:MAG: DUF2085 domain-containing protein [Sedimentisphaerales bacterium]|nr:DUF2085 domain-containing protein [Sedimentisphaerales bacterium]